MSVIERPSSSDQRGCALCSIMIITVIRESLYLYWFICTSEVESVRSHGLFVCWPTRLCLFSFISTLQVVFVQVRFCSFTRLVRTPKLTISILPCSHTSNPVHVCVPKIVLQNPFLLCPRSRTAFLYSYLLSLVSNCLVRAHTD